MNRLKLTVVGDGAVGKTCLLWMYGENKFQEDHVPTVLQTFSMHANVLDKDRTVELFDTAGQEEYDRLRLLAYPGTNVFFVCFDVTKPGSFQNVKQRWIPEVRHNLPLANIILVGTKCDLRQKPPDPKIKPISEQMGRKLAKEIKAEFYMECSAKTGEGINALFSNTFKWFFSENRTPRKPNNTCKFL